jgi:hypothetical protein
LPPAALPATALLWEAKKRAKRFPYFGISRAFSRQFFSDN